MDATEHRRIREKVGLSQASLGGLIGVGQTAVAQRDQGVKPVPEAVALLMRYMDRYGAPDTALAENDE